MGDKKPQIDVKKCIGCGTCVSVCPQNVFEMKAGKSHVARPKDCIGCGACVDNCPVQAIKLVKA